MNTTTSIRCTIYAHKRVKGNGSKRKRFISDKGKIGESLVWEDWLYPSSPRRNDYVDYDSVIDIYVITDAMHGALNGHKVASQEAKTIHKDETIYEEQHSLEAEGFETESLEIDIYETESGKEDEYGITNILDETTSDHEDTIFNELKRLGSILFLFFLTVLATKSHKLEIRERERKVPRLAEEKGVAPVKMWWWRREETLREARTRVNEIIESGARIAMFEEMSCLD
ncbi:MAG: hypothetical protein Q9175_002723 [Cornicularia normoerica]